MRWAALAILFIAALVGGAVAAIILSDVSLEELRDIVIIVYAAMSVLLLIVLIIVALGLWIATRLLVRAVVDLLEDPVRPTLEEVRASARNIRGATEFIADSTVHPLIRVISVGRGIRRGLARVTGLARRGR